MMFQDPATSSWKNRYFKVNGEDLEYYASRKDPEMLGKIPLRDCKVTIENQARFMSVLCIREPQGREYFAYATPVEETRLWRDALNLIINRLADTPKQSEAQSVNIPEHDSKRDMQIFYYLVSSGENIVDIATLFGATVPWIQSYNHFPLNILQPGTYVAVPYFGELPEKISSNVALMQAHVNGAPAPIVQPNQVSPQYTDLFVCKVCFENPINTVLLECGHSALCVECAKEITGKPCPFCRRPVSRVVVTYRA